MRAQHAPKTKPHPSRRAFKDCLPSVTQSLLNTLQKVISDKKSDKSFHSPTFWPQVPSAPRASRDRRTRRCSPWSDLTQFQSPGGGGDARPGMEGGLRGTDTGQWGRAQPQAPGHNNKRHWVDEVPLGASLRTRQQDSDVAAQGGPWTAHVVRSRSSGKINFL